MGNDGAAATQEVRGHGRKGPLRNENQGDSPAEDLTAIGLDLWTLTFWLKSTKSPKPHILAFVAPLSALFVSPSFTTPLALASLHVRRISQGRLFDVGSGQPDT